MSSWGEKLKLPRLPDWIIIFLMSLNSFRIFLRSKLVRFVKFTYLRVVTFSFFEKEEESIFGEWTFIQPTRSTKMKALNFMMVF